MRGILSILKTFTFFLTQKYFWNFFFLLVFLGLSLDNIRETLVTSVIDGLGDNALQGSIAGRIEGVISVLLRGENDSSFENCLRL